MESMRRRVGHVHHVLLLVEDREFELLGAAIATMQAQIHAMDGILIRLPAK